MSTNLGFYENFPETIHEIAQFASSVSSKKLQEKLLKVFYEINGANFSLKDITNPSVPKYTIIFELGIAKARNFYYLDNEETRKVLKAIQKRSFKIMDFFCALCYYKIINKKKTPLKFDYYMIRNLFNKNLMETQIFHERGPRHVLPEDIINFFVGKINRKFSRKVLKVLDKC